MYWMVPVHPQDRSLLGVQWEGQAYVDAALPFGLRSAPKFLADGLEWIAKEHGVECFITLGAANSDECKLNLQNFQIFAIIWGYQYHKRRWRGHPHAFHTH